MNIARNRIALVVAALLAAPTCLAQSDEASTAAPPSANPLELLRQGAVTFDAAAPAEIEVRKAKTGHLLVRPRINGRDAGWFIFDTGAGICVAANSVIESLELERTGSIAAAGAGGQSTAPTYRAKELRLGRLCAADHPIMGVDLAFLEPHLGEKIAGVIGFGVLSKCVAVLDLEKPAIALHDPAAYKLERGAWAPLDLSARVPVVTAKFEGHEGRFLLDTGDHSHVSFNEPTVQERDLLAGRSLTDGKLGGVGGFVACKRGSLARLEIGGRELTDVPANFATEAKGTYAQTDRAGAIGAGVLQQFELVVDYGGERIAFVPRTGAAAAAAGVKSDE